MYTMDDKAVSDLAKGLENIVRSARTLIENPEDDHHKLDEIIKVTQIL